MKILVFADIHGSLDAMQKVLQIAQFHQPNKVVFCGDLFGGWSSNEQIAQMAQSINSVLYFVRGNNDRFGCEGLLACGLEDYVVMYHFGKTLFFTHGDRYNGWNIPPVLQENDALIFGHTHTCSLQKRNGLFVLNVGSVARPRDGLPCYMILEETGATLCNLQNKEVYKLPWQ